MKHLKTAMRHSSLCALTLFLSGTASAQEATTLWQFDTGG